MRRMAAYLSILLIAMASATAAAQPGTVPSGPQYQVELLIFTYSSGPAAAAGNFSGIGTAFPAAPPAGPQAEPAWLPLGFLPQTYTPARWQVTNPQQLLLTASFQRLSSLSTYQPLVHLTWQQPVGLPSNQPAVIQLDGLADGRLQGQVRLNSGNVLSLRLDLEYLPLGRPQVAALSADDPFGPPFDPLFDSGAPLSTAPSIAAAQPIYRLALERRVSAGEYHYFDHPMFGIVAVVRRID